MSSQAAIEVEEKSVEGRAERAVKVSIESVMKSYEGRLWMQQVLERCGVLHDRYKFDGDALGAMFRDGMAHVGHFLLDQLEVYTPDEYQRMRREHRKRSEAQVARNTEKEKQQTQDDPAAALMREQPGAAWPSGGDS